MRPSARASACFAVLLGVTLAGETARAADPTTPECLAASETSLALRNQHKLREARAQILICSAGTCPVEIREECVHRMAEINATIPTIVFEFKDGSGNDIGNVQMTMDGQPMAERLRGTALSADPGEHAFTFETAGQPSVQKQYILREGEKNRRERIVFGVAVAPAPAKAAPAPAPVVVGTPGTPPPPEAASGGLGTARVLAIVAAGIGAVGLGVGIKYGLDAISKRNDAHNACPGQCMDTNGVTLWRQASSAGNVSTAAFIVGAVGLAGGAALWFAGKPDPGPANEHAGTQVGLGIGSVQLKGAW